MVSFCFAKPWPRPLDYLAPAGGDDEMTDDPPPQRPLRTGRPRLEEDRRLSTAITTRFTRSDADQIRAAAAAMKLAPTAAVRALALRGAGITDPRVHIASELRTVGVQLARIAHRLEHRRRRPTPDDLEEMRTAVAAVGGAVAAALAQLAPRVDP